MPRASTLWRSLLCCAGLVLPAGHHASAHHSFAAEFDAKRLLALHGTIVKLEWANPHVFLWIDVRGAAGVAERWGFELPPPNVLSRKSVHRAMLKPGRTITVTAFPARDGRTFANAQTLVLDSGRTIEARTPGTAVPGVREQGPSGR